MPVQSGAERAAWYHPGVEHVNVRSRLSRMPSAERTIHEQRQGIIRRESHPSRGKQFD